jgi:hypothetical protein
MKVRTTAKMGADFPDDQIEEDGEIVRPAGKGIASAIGEILARAGATVSEPFISEHGWELDIKYKDRNPWCEIQDGGGYIYLHIDDRWAWFDHRPEYIELVVALNAGLHRDPRFRNIRWYDRGDINQEYPTSDGPVD